MAGVNGPGDEGTISLADGGNPSLPPMQNLPKGPFGKVARVIATATMNKAF